MRVHVRPARIYDEFSQVNVASRPMSVPATCGSRLVAACMNNRYMARRVRARGLQADVGRVPSRGNIVHPCNQARAGQASRPASFSCRVIANFEEAFSLKIAKNFPQTGLISQGPSVV